MNFFAFQENLYTGDKHTQDEEGATKGDAGGQPPAPHGQESSAKVIKEFSDKDHILSAEELIEHRKHCRAKPGNCPFEKAVDEADEITPTEIKVTKQDVFNRLANVLTQLFQVAKNLAKPAIAEPDAVEAAVSPSAGDKTPTNGESSPTKQVGDEAPSPTEPNTDAKIVAEIIEGGIEKMVELAKGKGCMVDMDENNTKYIVRGPVETK